MSDLGKGRVEIKGLKELTKQLKKLPKDLQRKELRAAALAGAGQVRDEARKMAPVKTGRVKEDIRARYKPRQGPADMIYMVGVVDRKKHTAYWWRFNEFGTKHQPARPFMRPAFDMVQNRIIRIFKERLKKGIDRYNRKK